MGLNASYVDVSITSILGQSIFSRDFSKYQPHLTCMLSIGNKIMLFKFEILEISQG